MARTRRKRKRTGGPRATGRQGRQRKEPRLTGRQLQCLLFVAKGRSDRQIGKALRISEQTVHKHVEAAKNDGAEVKGQESDHHDE